MSLPNVTFASRRRGDISRIPFIATTVLAVASFSSAVPAGTWASPDGAISITIPEGSSLSPVDAPPAPAVAMWDCTEGIRRVVVVTAPNPTNAVPEVRGLEEGTLSIAPGSTLVRSTTETVNGHRVYSITFRIGAGDDAAYGAQRIVAVPSQIYKVMAVSEVEPYSDAALIPILNSLQVMAPLPPAPTLTPRERTREFTRKLTQFTVLGAMTAGAIGLVVYLVRRSRGGPSAQRF